ncbi:hypothetical protein HK098_006205 [Nowakowskiella sp. JEL0407]|nr:hypothetical protein HK098_006205 [Nowakowskiella sp. JEL0407]
MLKCCCCIPLRTGTLILAFLLLFGQIGSIYSSRSYLYQYGLPVYASYTAMGIDVLLAIFCVVGIIGVLRRNLKMVNFFAGFYLFLVILSFIKTAGAIALVIIYQSYISAYCELEAGNGAKTTQNIKSACETAYIIIAVIIGGVMFLISLLNVYFYLCVKSYAVELRKDQASYAMLGNRDSFENQPFVQQPYAQQPYAHKV